MEDPFPGKALLSNRRRQRVYVEIPKPSRVELKCSQNPEALAEGFDVIFFSDTRDFVTI
jgi:hypothetical protein